MRTRLSLLFGLVITAAAVIVGCSQDVSTDSLSVMFKNVSVLSETVQGKQVITSEMVIHVINRTEHGMNIILVDGTILDAATNTQMLTFRPIVPNSYGAVSTVQLLPKQTKDFTIVTPPDGDPFSTRGATTAIVKLSILTSDQYRTEIVSQPVAITIK
jgi:hypothetical protein